MLRSILFQNRGKIFAGIFITLIVFLWLSMCGINFAQSPNPGEIEKMRSIQIINPHPPFSLRVWLDQGREATYAPGERIKIFFQTSQDSFVTLYNYDIEGRVKIIFPNQYSPNDFVKAGQTYSIEGLIDLNTRAGIEYIQGFATSRELLITEREKNLISKEFMPEVSKDYKNYTNTIKGIIVTLPPTSWVTSNLINYTVKSIIPPPANYGRIIVTSQPQGAKVYLDNVYKGITPINLDRITPGHGQQEIRLAMAGYQDWSNYVSVSPSQTTTVSVDLIPLTIIPPPPANYGRIIVTSQPQGAKAYLDNVYKGITPLNLDRIASGQQEIRLAMAGYQDWINYVSVSPSQTTTVSADLIPLVSYGSISINCNQDDAEIYLDRSFQKRTYANRSVELKNIKQGYHELLITKDGYQDWMNNIMVTANQTFMVSAYLVPEINYNGSISVYCNINAAKIFLNGTYKATTLSSQPRILGEIKEGKYEITLIMDGYRTWVEDIWVYAGETISLYVEMNSIDY